MKTMPKLVQALLKLLGDDRFKKPDSDEIDLTKITYLDAIEVFTTSGVTEENVFSDVRDMVLAEISFGLATIMNGGGPANPENTVRYEGLTALLKLWRETVACRADLEEEEHRERTRLREGADMELAGEQGGANAEGTDVAGD